MPEHALPSFCDQRVMRLEPPSRRGHPGMLDLSRNELIHPRLDEVIREVLGSARAEASTRYPIYRDLVAELAPHLGCAAEELEVFPGSDDAIGVIIDALGRDAPGRGQPRMLLQDPNYDGYRYHAGLRGIEILPWPPRPGTFRFEPSDVTRAMAQLPPTIVVVTEPHGSFGTALGDPAVLGLAAAACLHGHMLVVDTCYQAFADAEAAQSAAELRQSGQSVMVVGSFSKALGLAGLRLGYVIACPELIGYLRRWRRAAAVSGITMHAALQILSRHAARMKAIRADVTEGRDWLAGQVTGLQRGWRPLPSSTNFLTVDVGTPAMARRVIDDLAQRKIAVRSHAARPAFASLIQITAAPAEVLRSVAAALASIEDPSQATS
jgi:histidinol-phosphate aminotransferase